MCAAQRAAPEPPAPKSSLIASAAAAAGAVAGRGTGGGLRAAVSNGSASTTAAGPANGSACRQTYLEEPLLGSNALGLGTVAHAVVKTHMVCAENHWH